MNIRIIFLGLFCLGLFTFCEAIRSVPILEVKSHIFIRSWDIIPFRKRSVIVNVAFDKEVVNLVAGDYIRFLKSLTKKYIGIGVHQYGENHYIRSLCILFPEGLFTRDEIESMLNQTNHHFDPGYETPEEIAAAEVEKKRKLEVTQQQNDDALLKKQLYEIKANEDATNQLKLAAKKPDLLAMFHNAIINGSVGDLRKAVNAGALINCGKDGRSSLLWAVLLKKPDIVEELLKQGVEKQVSYLDKSLINHAIILNDFDTAGILLKNGVICEIENKEKVVEYVQQKLEQAIRSNSPELIRQSIRLGADVNSSNFYGKELIQVTKDQSIDFFKQALKKYSDEEINYARKFKDTIQLWNLPVLLAVSLKHYEALEELLKQVAKIDELGFPIIERSLKFNDIKSALLLIRKGADINNYSKADIGFDCTLLSNIIYRICNPSLGEVPLNFALEFIEELIKRNCEINSDLHLNNALYLLFFYGSRLNTKDFNFLLEFFLKKGVDVNKSIFVKSTGAHWTPLMCAIYMGLAYQENSIESIKLLLSYNANLNLKALPNVHPIPRLRFDSPITPLFYAIQIGEQQVINLLIERGALL